MEAASVATGATISSKSIPGGMIVGMLDVLVRKSSAVFDDPNTFKLDRWLGKDAKTMVQWLVAFSKGLRSCLGNNPVWCELYIAFATMLRCFEMKLDGTTCEDLVWRDCFAPHYHRRHLRVWCQPIAT